jgi:hypothetical protein
MTSIHDDSLMRAAFAPARALEPSDAEVADVLSRVAARRRPARPRRAVVRRVVPIGAAALLVLGGAYATAEPVRAAIDDVAGTLGLWTGADPGVAPGRPLHSSDKVPDYFHDPRFANEPRVIAQAGGYKLFAARAPDNGVTFDLGNSGVGMTLTPDAGFDGQAVLILGPAAMRSMDRQGHVPLFGIANGSVASVELTYASGPPLRIDHVDRGFVLLAEPDRSPRAVVAFDAAGREVERRLVDASEHDGPRIDWTQYL